MKVRCNECMNIFEEDELGVDEDGIERCPHCGREYALMDMEDEDDAEEQ